MGWCSRTWCRSRQCPARSPLPWSSPSPTPPRRAAASCCPRPSRAGAHPAAHAAAARGAAPRRVAQPDVRSVRPGGQVLPRRDVLAPRSGHHPRRLQGARVFTPGAVARGCLGLAEPLPAPATPSDGYCTAAPWVATAWARPSPAACARAAPAASSPAPTGAVRMTTPARRRRCPRRCLALRAASRDGLCDAGVLDEPRARGIARRRRRRRRQQQLHTTLPPAHAVHAAVRCRHPGTAVRWRPQRGRARVRRRRGRLSRPAPRRPCVQLRPIPHGRPPSDRGCSRGSRRLRGGRGGGGGGHGRGGGGAGARGRASGGNGVPGLLPRRSVTCAAS